jgi:hypothetical protein
VKNPTYDRNSGRHRAIPLVEVVLLLLAPVIAAIVLAGAPLASSAVSAAPPVEPYLERYLVFNVSSTASVRGTRPLELNGASNVWVSIFSTTAVNSYTLATEPRQVEARVLLSVNNGKTWSEIDKFDVHRLSPYAAWIPILRDRAPRPGKLAILFKLEPYDQPTLLGVTFYVRSEAVQARLVDAAVIRTVPQGGGRKPAEPR